MLSDKQLQHVCLLNQGACQCRYLESDPKDWRSYYCVKLLSKVKKKRDAEVGAHLTLCKKGRTDPYTLYVPIGDGAACKGYTCLKHVKQGYDIPGS